MQVHSDVEGEADIQMLSHARSESKHRELVATFVRLVQVERVSTLSSHMDQSAVKREVGG